MKTRERNASMPSIHIWQKNQSLSTYSAKECTDICRWGPCWQSWALPGPTLHTETTRGQYANRTDSSWSRFNHTSVEVLEDLTLVFEDKITVPQFHWIGFWAQVWIGRAVWISPWCEQMAIIEIISIHYSLLPSCSVTSVTSSSTAAHWWGDQFSRSNTHATTHTQTHTHIK